MADAPTANLELTGNPGLDSLIRSALVALSTGLTVWSMGYLTEHGFGNDPNIALLISGMIGATVLGLATALWGWLKGSRIGQVIASKEAVAVMAGINLAASGNATTTINTDGNRVPTPVTAATTQEIIKNFGPETPPPVLGKPTPPGVDEQAETRRLNKRKTTK